MNGLSESPSAAAIAYLKIKLSAALDQVSALQDSTGPAVPTTPRQRGLSVLDVQGIHDRLINTVDHQSAVLRIAMAAELDKFTAAVRATVDANITPAALQAAGTARSDKKPIFSEKIFHVRVSMLSHMLQDKDFQTIYHIFVTCMVWLGVSVLLQEVADGGRVFDLSMMAWAFGELGTWLPLWLFLFAWSFTPVILVQIIKTYKVPLVIWCWPYAAIQIVQLWAPVQVALSVRLPPAAGFIVTCEAVRMGMKMHAYLREKMLYGVPNSLATYIPTWAKNAGVTVADLNAPTITIEDFHTEFGRYLYFHFAPTLVYRDQYPQVASANWLRAFTHFGNVAGCVVYTFVIFRAFCIPYFRATANNPGDWITFALSVFRSMMPSVMVFLFAFFGVLHSWFNGWAELLRFGDRQFYQDWWNARSFGTYYRKWNIVVHDFLYYYVYQDAIRLSRGRVSKAVAALWVFILSAILHEFIITFAIGFFYPVLLVMFGGPGVFFVRMTKGNTRMFNVFMWLTLSVGLGMLMVLYSREWFARFANLPTTVADVEGVLSFFIPRSWPSHLFGF